MHPKSETLLLPDVSKTSEKCVKISHLEISFSSSISIASSFKKTEVKLELLTDIDMPLIVEKSIRGVICHAIYRYGKS